MEYKKVSFEVDYDEVCLIKWINLTYEHNLTYALMHGDYTSFIVIDLEELSDYQKNYVTNFLMTQNAQNIKFE